MEPGPTPCTFKVQSMSSVFPAGPDEVFDMKKYPDITSPLCNPKTVCSPPFFDPQISVTDGVTQQQTGTRSFKETYPTTVYKGSADGKFCEAVIPRGIESLGFTNNPISPTKYYLDVGWNRYDVDTSQFTSPIQDICNKIFLNTSACGEVFYVDTKAAQKEMANICKDYKATVATKAQLTSSQLAGADWCAPGWVVDVSGMAYSPKKYGAGFGCSPGTSSSTDLTISTTSLAGVHCFGTKPDNVSASPVKPFSPAAWNQPGICANTTVNYVNPKKEGFNNYGTPIQIRESTAPLQKMGFGSDRTRNSDTPALNTQYEEPLRQKTTLETAPGPKYIDADDSIKPEKAKNYRYIRFRPIKTRNPNSYEVSVGKFRFFLGPNEIDMRNANVTNPMGTWVGDIGDVVGDGYTNGWSDAHKKALVFSFPYSILINGFTWTTANPDKGVDSDPVQWKLEGSDNGVYWVTLRNQTNHNYPVPKERFQELPIFRF